MIAPLPPLTRIAPDIVAATDYARYARDRLTPPVRAWLDGGAGDDRTLRENRRGFARLRLVPRALVPMASGHTRLDLFGQTLEHPLLLAPIAFQRLVHPDGEVATALAAAAMRATMVVSTQASTALETVAVRSGASLWFQLYIQPDRAFTHALVHRAEQAGYRALVVTIDAPAAGLRHREQRAGFVLPADVQAVNLTGMPLPPGHLARPGESPLLGSRLLADAATWTDLSELCRQTRLPVVVKGIMNGEDARQALDAGAAGIIVSNHGGRTLDCAPATIEMLPEVVAAVGARAPVLLDGGIRSGSDALKALVLGAKAVLIGRPFMHALATAGAPGVAHVLHLLRAELESAMVQTGCPTLADASPGMLRRSVVA